MNRAFIHVITLLARAWPVSSLLTRWITWVLGGSRHRRKGDRVGGIMSCLRHEQAVVPEHGLTEGAPICVQLARSRRAG